MGFLFLSKEDKVLVLKVVKMAVHIWSFRISHGIASKLNRLGNYTKSMDSSSYVIKDYLYL
uniref:Uncharacterized protein n=1 Tax=Arundo donax TaxID=35708 RepID=A0A0A9C4R4_ARUDO